MYKKINRFLLLEKVPAIVCMLACTVSVLMGFTIGYIFFAPGGYTAYADASGPYYAEVPCMAELYVEAPVQTAPPIQNHSETYEEEAPAYMYVVTILDGYIVVYHSGDGGLKEVTNTAVGALAPEELEYLAKGVRVYSDEALARILQDYGS